MDRKTTAWKKSRKFGDVHGGRCRPKLSDNIFRRCHSLKAPAKGVELPILIQDNPSRNFFFPISAHEACAVLRALPERDTSGITHIWCRRLKKSEFGQQGQPMAEFICGSGVRVIILYPWRRDMTLSWTRKPQNRLLNEMSRFGFKIMRRRGEWVVQPTLPQLRLFYIEHLLYHEVGHHVDWYNRHWSAGNHKQVEEYATQYAIQKTSSATYVLNRLENT
jgi:hypothetical protein